VAPGTQVKVGLAPRNSLQTSTVSHGKKKQNYLPARLEKQGWVQEKREGASVHRGGGKMGRQHKGMKKRNVGQQGKTVVKLAERCTGTRADEEYVRQATIVARRKKHGSQDRSLD